MTALMLAVLVGVLFTCGTLLILQRGQIKVSSGPGAATAMASTWRCSALAS